VHELDAPAEVDRPAVLELGAERLSQRRAGDLVDRGRVGRVVDVAEAVDVPRAPRLGRARRVGRPRGEREPVETPRLSAAGR